MILSKVVALTVLVLAAGLTTHCTQNGGSQRDQKPVTYNADGSGLSSGASAESPDACASLRERLKKQKLRLADDTAGDDKEAEVTEEEIAACPAVEEENEGTSEDGADETSLR